MFSKKKEQRNKLLKSIKHFGDSYRVSKKKPFIVLGRFPINVRVYKDTPEKGMVTFITVGLSYFDLNICDHNLIRQELVLTIEGNYQDDVFENLLYKISMKMIKERRPLFPEEVIDINVNGLVNVVPTEYSNLVAESGVWFDPELLTFYVNDIQTVFVEILLVSNELGSLALTNFESYKQKYRLASF